MRKLAPGLWVERPGQDLNLRGVTQRFSRPPPYRARRPGQRFILKTKARIRVSDPGAEDRRLKAAAPLDRLDAGGRRSPRPQGQGFRVSRSARKTTTPEANFRAPVKTISASSPRASAKEPLTIA